MSPKNIIFQTALATCFLALCNSANAQQRTTERLGLKPAIGDSRIPPEFRPAYQPIGMPVGGFQLYPEMTVEGAYDDNLFATSFNKIADWVMTLNPALHLRSRWARHALNLDAELIDTRHARTQSEDTTDWSVGADGRLDILRRTALDGEIEYARRSETRGIATAIDDAAQPTRFNILDAAVGLRQRFNKLFAEVRATFTGLSYDPVALVSGGSQSNRDRDRQRYSGQLRMGFDVSPDTNIYAQGEVERIEYDLQPPLVAQNGDSTGFEAGAGVELRAGLPLHGNIFVGYRHRNYAGGLSDVSALSYRADLYWEASALTTLHLFANSRVVEIQAGGTSIVSQSVGLGLTQYFLRNLRLNASVQYMSNEFQNSIRSDNVWDASLRLDYLINRNFTLGLGYQFRTQSSTELFSNFDRNIVFASLRTQF
jgi:hypothetical protein